MKQTSIYEKINYGVSLLPQVKWHTTLFVFITPLLALYGIVTIAFVWKTWLLACACFVPGISALGTSYHRLYAHRTFKVTRSIELWWLFWATTDFSMSAINWVKDHRAHHKYTETEKDPYNIKLGFWWAHVGWLMWKRERPTFIDVSDLERDPVLRFQHKYFAILAFAFGWGLPTLACGLLWGDWWGGFYVASVAKTVALHHGIFCINSWAHTFGEADYNDAITPRDSVICAIITAGEGYHNFHHEFPNDYRNGVHLTALDLNKWIIASLEKSGLAWDLKRTSPDQIQLSKLQMAQRKIERESSRLFVGKSIEALPYYTELQVADLVKEKGEFLVTKGDLVYDVRTFIEEHPGGRGYLNNYLGRDISEAFRGGVYAHSNSAQNILQTLRCGRLIRMKSHDA